MSTDCGIALNPPSNNSNHQCLDDIPSLLLTRSACQTASDRVCSVSLGAENSNSKLSPPLPTRKLRHLSAPGDIPVHRQTSPTVAISHSLETSSFPPTSSDDEGGEGDWMAPDPVFVVQRAVSVGSKQYGFTSLGRGFNWLGKEEEERNRIRRLSRSRSRSRRSIEHPLEDAVVTPPPTTACILGESLQFEPEPQRPPNGTVVPTILAPSTESSSSNPPVAPLTMSRDMGYTVLSVSPSVQSPVSSRRSTTPPSPTTTRPTAAHSPTSPRPPSRRRSSHKRVSLVAGRIRVTEDMPLPGTDLPPTLGRTNSQSSFLSAAASTGPPSPLYEHEHFLGNHHINDYVIEGEAGRGAYGTVKRAREKLPNGQRGVSLVKLNLFHSRLTCPKPPLIVKQVIKSRILADCWKKHPKHGTIPIEIYVMSSISNTSYVLPSRRPWDPSRPSISHPGPISSDWEEGAVVKGHPNICPLLDFFEDAHFYYLVMPSTSPPPSPHEEVLPSDLFDLVELYPQGLPAHLIRSYLGQIADALCFLHSKGIGMPNILILPTCINNAH